VFVAMMYHKQSMMKMVIVNCKLTDNSAFYCSQYLWYLYWKTAKDLGYDLDIDADGGYFVAPYDLLNSK
jgi:uncharacterized protein YycO